jgi:hypothetical protein
MLKKSIKTGLMRLERFICLIHQKIEMAIFNLTTKKVAYSYTHTKKFKLGFAFVCKTKIAHFYNEN